MTDGNKNKPNTRANASIFLFMQYFANIPLCSLYIRYSIHEVIKLKHNMIDSLVIYIASILHKSLCGQNVETRY